jgi:hypothetical protein
MAFPSEERSHITCILDKVFIGRVKYDQRADIKLCRKQLSRIVSDEVASFKNRRRRKLHIAFLGNASSSLTFNASVYSRSYSPPSTNPLLFRTCSDNDGIIVVVVIISQSKISAFQHLSALLMQPLSLASE